MYAFGLVVPVGTGMGSTGADGTPIKLTRSWYSSSESCQTCVRGPCSTHAVAARRVVITRTGFRQELAVNKNPLWVAKLIAQAAKERAHPDGPQSSPRGTPRRPTLLPSLVATGGLKEEAFFLCECQGAQQLRLLTELRPVLFRGPRRGARS